MIMNMIINPRRINGPIRRKIFFFLMSDDKDSSIDMERKEINFSFVYEVQPNFVRARI